MDIRQLEYFVRVAELGNVTRASIDLDVTQPALSRQIRQLETELRQNLLIRHGRGVELTEAGKVLLEHARVILHQLQRAREDVGRVRGGLGGHVAVGLPPGIAKMLAVPLTRAFRAQLPDATVSIAEGLSLQLQDQLIGGHLDVALLYNAAWSPELECTCVLEEDFFLVTLRRPGMSEAPIGLHELAAEPLIIPTRSHAIRTLVESRLAGIGCRPTIALEVDGIAAILDLVADGAGSAVLSLNAVVKSGREPDFACRPISNLRIELMQAVSARRPATLTQQAALQLLREVATKVLSREPGTRPPSSASPGPAT
ncbi:MAG: LysR family transcriptional regulator [Burkholderiales bacterium]|nr:LysR family transcriptional regulator [Burkholderiales bacterium]